MKQHDFINNKFKKTSLFACTLTVLLCTILYLLPQKQKTQEIKQEDTFHITSYIINNEKLPEPATKDTAGETREMDKTMKQSVIKIVPSLAQLSIPSDFHTVIQFLQYSFEAIGPYPVIQYQSVGMNNQSISATIEDRRIAQCIPLDEKKLKPYKDYKLCVYHLTEKSGIQIYSVHGIKDSFRFSIYACVLNQTDFESYLISFLL